MYILCTHWGCLHEAILMNTYIYFIKSRKYIIKIMPHGLTVGLCVTLKGSNCPCLEQSSWSWRVRVVEVRLYVNWLAICQESVDWAVKLKRKYQIILIKCMSSLLCCSTIVWCLLMNFCGIISWDFQKVRWHRKIRFMWRTEFLSIILTLYAKCCGVCDLAVGECLYNILWMNDCI